jgi:protein arginine kinase activator
MFKCDICGKNPAKIHSTKIIDGKVESTHLCQECAHKQAAGKAIPLSGILGGLFKIEEAAAPLGSKGMQTCEVCGQTYRSFKETGRLGCAACYDTFEKHLLPLIAQVQKGDRHIGKRPRNLAPPSLEDRLEGLRQDLQRAVAKEEFERAAALRDEIRKLDSAPPAQDS